MGVSDALAVLFTVGAAVLAGGVLAWNVEAMFFGGVIVWHAVYGGLVLWSDRP